MNTLKTRLAELKPAFVLFYLSLMGFLCITAVQFYLRMEFDLMPGMAFMAMIFGIYALNRFTDTAEDFTNDIGRLLFFQRKRFFFAFAIACLAVSSALLLANGKLNWMHTLLLTIGFAYSYRLMPWYTRERGFHLIRIKEMVFVKNLAVSFLWGSAAMALPILDKPGMLASSPLVHILAAGLFLSTFNNTLFDDILDVDGDRMAGIKTLPTTLGVERCYRLLWILDGAWLLGVAGAWLAGRFDLPHAIFLSALAGFPVFYMALHRGGRISKSALDFLSESDLLLFAAGLAVLRLL